MGRNLILSIYCWRILSLPSSIPTYSHLRKNSIFYFSICELYSRSLLHTYPSIHVGISHFCIWDLILRQFPPYNMIMKEEQYHAHYLRDSAGYSRQGIERFRGTRSERPQVLLLLLNRWIICQVRLAFNQIKPNRELNSYRDCLLEMITKINVFCIPSDYCN